MKNAVLAIAVAVLSASPAFAGGFGLGSGQSSSSTGGLVSVGGLNVSALNGSGGVLNNTAAGTVLNNVANGNRTNVLGVQGVTGIVRGLIGGGGSHGCGCN